MPDMQKVQATKERILSAIKEKGPAYPAIIAREAGISPLFTAAFLSELVSDRKLKISNMKIGSSPIYYIEGQEPQLESFVEHINHKEREAFEILKKSQVLDDEGQEPAIRVALRKIKDFAIPVNVRIDGETRLFWRYSQFSESETRDKIRDLLSPSQKQGRPRQKQEEHKAAQIKEEKTKVDEAVDKQAEEQITKQPKLKIPKQKNPVYSEFAESVKDYLAAKDIEILNELSVKKKEFTAKVRIDTLFGKQEYLLTAKDKKKISQNDLTIAIQESQAEKMPSILISPGEIDKKSLAYLEEWRNVIKFDKIKI